MRRQFVVFGAISTAFLLSGLSCQPGPPDALIHYQESNVCQQIHGGLDAVPGAKIIVIKINSIDNTQVGTQWTFDRKGIVFDPLSQCQANVTGSKQTVIPPHQSVTINQTIAVAFVSNDPSNATLVRPALLYGQNSVTPACASQLGLQNTPPSFAPPSGRPGIIFINDNPSANFQYNQFCN
jgi:hypothetical protein